MQKEFHIIIEKDKHGYFARCIDVDGCFAQGDTYEEVEKEMKDAIQLHLMDKENGGDEFNDRESISLSSIKVMMPA